MSDESGNENDDEYTNDDGDGVSLVEASETISGAEGRDERRGGLREDGSASINSLCLY